MVINLNTFGVSSAGEATWKCWICQKYSFSRQSSPFSSGSGECDKDYHQNYASRFLSNGGSHTRDERFLVVDEFFDSRIKSLMFEGDSLKVRGLLYPYLLAESDWKLAMVWLDWFERKDRIRLSMLAAWKCLAQARAGDEIIHVGPETTVQMAWEKCLELRNDWEKHKQVVLDAGQVYMVGKLVNPFLGVANSSELMTE
jgi:hypothetical protein